MAKKLTDYYVLEYSVQQNSHHIRTVGEMLANNHSNIIRRTSTDFVPILFTETREQAVAISRDLGIAVDSYISAEEELARKIRLVFSVSDCEEPDESEP